MSGGRYTVDALKTDLKQLGEIRDRIKHPGFQPLSIDELKKRRKEIRSRIRNQGFDVDILRDGVYISLESEE